MVVDELHMVCDPHRGLPLELLITKLLFSQHANSIQLIGMSATMGGEFVTAVRGYGGEKGRWLGRVRVRRWGSFFCSNTSLRRHTKGCKSIS